MPSPPNSPERAEELRDWIEGETGMDFSGSRINRLQEALRKVAYFEDRQSEESGKNPSGPFLERLTAQLTVGESFFFRNSHHFQGLRDEVFPDILRQNRQREIRLWSAGCAGGEEPYSLGILLDQLLGEATGWNISILATDLNPAFLDKARQGIYRPWSFRMTDIHEDSRYFSGDKNGYLLCSRVRERVRFAYLNLVKDIYPSAATGTLGLDLIVFRNVSIYLKASITQAILQRMHRALRPGGWLLLGETEVHLAPRSGFEVRRFGAATFFQKSLSEPFQPTWRSPSPVLAEVREDAPTTETWPAWAPLPSRMNDPAGEQPGLAEPCGPSRWEKIQAYCENAQFDRAEQVIEQAAPGADRAELCLQYGKLLLQTGETVRARLMLDQCLRENPMSVEAQLLQANFAEEAGNPKAAEQAYRRALYLDRRCAVAHFHLALLQHARDPSAAQRSLRIALQLCEERDPHALVEHSDGVCYGRLQEMITALHEANA